MNARKTTPDVTACVSQTDLCRRANSYLCVTPFPVVRRFHLRAVPSYG